MGNSDHAIVNYEYDPAGTQTSWDGTTQVAGGANWVSADGSSGDYASGVLAPRHSTVWSVAPTTNTVGVANSHGYSSMFNSAGESPTVVRYNRHDYHTATKLGLRSGEFRMTGLCSLSTSASTPSPRAVWYAASQSATGVPTDCLAWVQDLADAGKIAISLVYYNASGSASVLASFYTGSGVPGFASNLRATVETRFEQLPSGRVRCSYRFHLLTGDQPLWQHAADADNATTTFVVGDGYRTCSVTLPASSLYCKQDGYWGMMLGYTSSTGSSTTSTWEIFEASYNALDPLEPTIVQSTSNTGAAGVATCTLGASATAGNMLVLVVGAASVGAPTAPAGYTEHAKIQAATKTSVIYTKVAAGGETSASVTIGAGNIQAWLYEVANVFSVKDALGTSGTSAASFGTSNETTSITKSRALEIATVYLSNTSAGWTIGTTFQLNGWSFMPVSNINGGTLGTVRFVVAHRLSGGRWNTTSERRTNAGVFAWTTARTITRSYISLQGYPTNMASTETSGGIGQRHSTRRKARPLTRAGASLGQRSTGQKQTTASARISAVVGPRPAGGKHMTAQAIVAAAASPRHTVSTITRTAAALIEAVATTRASALYRARPSVRTEVAVAPRNTDRRTSHPRARLMAAIGARVTATKHALLSRTRNIGPALEATNGKSGTTIAGGASSTSGNGRRSEATETP